MSYVYQLQLYSELYVSLLFSVYNGVYFYTHVVLFYLPFFMWLEQRDCIKVWTPCIILTRSLALLKEGKLEAGIIL